MEEDVIPGEISMEDLEASTKMRLSPDEGAGLEARSAGSRAFNEIDPKD